MTITDVKQMNSLALAYIGDAVYELYVRDYLIKEGQVKPNQLHQKAITFVSGNAQSEVVRYWLENNSLSTEEERVVKRGRNAKSSSIPKNINVQAYRYSTGFEALLGFLYLSKNEERLAEILTAAVQFIEKKSQD